MVSAEGSEMGTFDVHLKDESWGMKMEKRTQWTGSLVGITSWKQGGDIHSQVCYMVTCYTWPDSC